MLIKSAFASLVCISILSTISVAQAEGGSDGVEFQVIPIPITENCSANILKGTKRYEGTAFVMPQGFLSKDESGQPLLEILPKEKSFLLRFGIRFPRDNEQIISRRGTEEIRIRSCDFEAIRRFIQKDTKTRVSIAQLPLKSIDFEMEGVSSKFRLGSARTDILNYQGTDQVVEFVVTRPELDELLRKLRGSIGLPLKMNLTFAAKRSDGYVQVKLDGEKLAADLHTILGANLKLKGIIAAPQLQIALREALEKSTSSAYIEASSDADFDTLARGIVRTILSEVAGWNPGNNSNGNGWNNGNGNGNGWNNGNGNGNGWNNNWNNNNWNSNNWNDPNTGSNWGGNTNGNGWGGSNTGWGGTGTGRRPPNDDPFEGWFSGGGRGAPAPGTGGNNNGNGGSGTWGPSPLPAPIPGTPGTGPGTTPPTGNGTSPPSNQPGYQPPTAAGAVPTVSIQAALNFIKSHKTINTEIQRMSKLEDHVYTTSTTIRASVTDPSVSQFRLRSGDEPKIVLTAAKPGAELRFVPVAKTQENYRYEKTTRYYTRDEFLSERQQLEQSFWYLRSVGSKKVKEYDSAGARRGYLGSIFSGIRVWGREEQKSVFVGGSKLPFDAANPENLAISVSFSKSSRSYRFAELMKPGECWESGYDSKLGFYTFKPKCDLGVMFFISEEQPGNAREIIPTRYFQEARTWWKDSVKWREYSNEPAQMLPTAFTTLVLNVILSEEGDSIQMIKITPAEENTNILNGSQGSVHTLP